MPYYAVTYDCGTEPNETIVTIKKHANTIPTLMTWLNSIMQPDLEKLFKNARLRTIIEEP